MSDVFYAGMADPATALYALKSRIESLGAPSLSSAAGPQGLKGLKGLRGNRGPSTPDCRTQLYGSGPPTPNKGKPGDFYFDLNRPYYYGGRTSFNFSPWMGMFLLDNYNGIAGTPAIGGRVSDSGHTMADSLNPYGSADPTLLKITDGGLGIDRDGSHRYASGVYSANPYNANYYVEIGVRGTEDSCSAGSIRVGARVQAGTGTGYFLETFNAAGGNVAILVFKEVGVSTLIARVDTPAPGIPLWTARLEVSTLVGGDVYIRALLNGIEVGNATDPAFGAYPDKGVITVFIDPDAGAAPWHDCQIKYIRAGTL